MSILKKIKSGKKNYKLIDFPGTTEKVALVTLSSTQTEQAKIQADQYILDKKITDEDYKDMVLQKFLAYEFTRDKDDREKNIADSFDEFSDSLDAQEIAYLVLQYNLFSQETSPFLNAVTDEQFELLKKTLATMTLKDLNGESSLALRNFLMSLVS